MDNINHRRQHLLANLIIILLLMILHPFCDAIEENQPEIFLSPRNFNPHPYALDPREQNSLRRVGPVLFPPSPPDDDSTSSNVVTLQQDRKLNHPIDNHPYAKVAQKYKQLLGTRFRDDINPKVYEALSNHAAKVLSGPPSQLAKDYTLSSLSDHKKNYAFSYKVFDHLTGDDFSHTQQQNGPATNGEYRVKLPDGRVQIVSYIADKNGYKADVKYTAEEHLQHNLPIPIAPPPSHLKPNSFVDSSYHLHQPDDYVDYVDQHDNGPAAVVYRHQPNVEIYTNGGGANVINRFSDYVVTTAAPSYLYSSPVGSTAAPHIFNGGGLLYK